MLENVGLIPNLIPEEHFFKKFALCIDALEEGTVKPDPSKTKSII